VQRAVGARPPLRRPKNAQARPREAARPAAPAAVPKTWKKRVEDLKRRGLGPTDLWVAALLVFLFYGSALAQPSRLTLQDYLNQVQQGHAALVAARAEQQGARDRSAEAELFYWPRLFAELRDAHDKSPRSSPAIEGTEAFARNYSFGVSQLTPVGLNARLKYEFARNDVRNVNPLFLSNPISNEGSFSIEVSQSLLRNFLGSETRAKRQALEAQYLARSSGEELRVLGFLAEAEISYWRLVLTRERVRIQQANVSRSARMLDRAQERARLQVGSRAETLQARAALRTYELELEVAKSEELTAARGFNSLRGRDEASVSEALDGMLREDLRKLKAPTRTQARADVRAAYERMRAAKAGAHLAREEALPTLEIFGSYALGGRDTQASEALSASFGSQNPSGLLGLRLETSLGVGALLRVRSGGRLQEEAAELEYRRVVLEEEVEWKNSLRRFTELKEQVDLAYQIEEAQLRKLEEERERFRQGKSNTYQIVLFERDYTTAQLARISLNAELLGLNARMKIFEGAM
jgi:outer membrane protein TolC